MIALLAEGFGLGLSTGLYCLGACAPLFVPYLLSAERTWSGQAWLIAEFMAGRLAAYLLFACGVMVLGTRIKGMPPWVLAAALFLSGAMMLFHAFIKNAPHLNLCASLSRSPGLSRFPLLLGFAVGVNLCPPFIAGLVRLLSLQEMTAGLLYFTAFFAGTSLYLLPLFVAVPLSRSARLQDIASLACVLAGMWFMGLGIVRLR